MSENKTDKVRDNNLTLSIEQLRSFQIMKGYSDDELRDVAIFLREFSIICYDAFIKRNVDRK